MRNKESLIDRLEKKLGKYAIHNLMFYIIALYVVGVVLVMMEVDGNSLYSTYFSLNVSAILHGQVWRLFTFIMQPPSTNLIFIIFVLYLYYMIGTQLEQTWGAFRFNLYFFSGVLFHIIAAFIVYALTGLSLELGTTYLNLSLFFAFAMEFPNVEFLLFFILPVKVKWLAILDGAFFVWTILQGILPSYGGNPFYGPFYRANAIAAFVSVLNFLIYILLTKKNSAYSPKQVARKRQYQQKMRQAQTRVSYPNGAKHRCSVCGRTELDDPNLEFRFCSKCNGNYEYCQDHLFTHEHKK